MTDFPIIFSAPMVRALIEGRKTQTRRITLPNCGIVDMLGDKKRRAAFAGAKPGDRLYVRENFSGPHEWSSVPPSGWGWDTMTRPPIWYWADGNPPDGDWTPPKPSIHMPRWASRLTLILTEVRRQRLRDITEEDARAEGVFWTTHSYSRRPITARDDFMDLWAALHGDDSWSENPDVVALSFDVVQANIDSGITRIAA